jgi:hypothetical protein
MQSQNAIMLQIVEIELSLSLRFSGAHSGKLLLAA